MPPQIRTRLKEHQVDSLAMQIADEQGPGKTLQIIAFLVWLKDHMKSDPGAKRGPFLIVAPTSLPENWEQEVANHVERPGLGHLIRLYGSATTGRKRAGAVRTPPEARRSWTFSTSSVRLSQARGT